MEKPSTDEQSEKINISNREGIIDYDISFLFQFGFEPPKDKIRSISPIREEVELPLNYRQ